MTGFNLSEWALRHRSLVAYLMIVAVGDGLVSYFRLGRNEDPTFVIKTIVVQAAWPGATVEETLKQGTERLERKLQETPQLDFLRSYTSAGATGSGRVLAWYRGFLTLAMRARWITIALTAALFGAAMLAVPLIPNQFFPASDRPELLVDLRLPQNASIHASESVADRFDAMLKDDADIARWSTYVGRGAIRFYLPLDVQLPNDFFAQSVIVAKDVGARERLRRKLEKVLAEQFPNLVARVSALELGPPVGWPVQYRVSGPELAQVRDIAFRLAEIVTTNRDAVNVNFDWIEPAREVHIRVGMITKNAVILIGQIEAERAHGKTVWQAAIDASSSRFRPIMLTPVSTVLGMIPIAPTVFWGPMAFAIMGRLLVGTVLTLVFLPTLYVTWFRGRETASEKQDHEELCLSSKAPGAKELPFGSG